MKDEETSRAPREIVEHQFTNAVFTFIRTYDPTTHAHTTNFSFSNPPKGFMDGLQKLTSWLPILRGNLHHEEEGEGGYEESFTVTVTDFAIVDTIVLAPVVVTSFVGQMICDALYDGSCVLEYMKDDSSWVVLSTITGNGADIIQSIATPSLLVADNVVAPVAKYPFNVRVRVATKATAGSCAIRLDVEE